MIVLSVYAVKTEVTQNVVHPAHIPFEVKAESAHINRFRIHRPGGAFLGYHHNVRKFRKNMLVERLQEFNRFKIFTSAVFICNPFAVLAVIVKVEH